MNFKTKFNIDDRAWCMNENVIIEVAISAIKIFHVGTNQDTVQYYARDVNNSVNWLDHKDLNEGELFRSKADLLMFISGDMQVCKGKMCNSIDGFGHSVECEKEHESQYNNVS